MPIWSGSIRSDSTKATMSMVRVVGRGRLARSSSVIGMMEPSASSNPLPISEEGTSFSSSSQTLR